MCLWRRKGKTTDKEDRVGPRSKGIDGSRISLIARHLWKASQNFVGNEHTSI